MVNTGSVTITDFLYGQEGQELVIYGDGFTTITHGTKIKTSTAANKLLATLKTYRFTRFSSVWVEQDSGSANPYVGKHITLYAGTPVTVIATGTFQYLNDNTNQWISVQDLTGMTQYRILYVSKGSNTNTVTSKLAYSTTGSSWTNFTANSAHNTSSILPEFESSGWTSLPAGAQIATCWLAIQFLVSVSTDIYTVSLEFKP